MRTLVIIAVLCVCFSSGPVFAQRPAVTVTILDSDPADPIGAIVGAVSKLDSWIQKNLW